jgi:hypothetical protein
MPHVPNTRAARQQLHLPRPPPPPPQQPSIMQPLQPQVDREEEEDKAEGLEDEDKEMRCQGQRRPHAEDEEDKGPTSEK